MPTCTADIPPRKSRRRQPPWLKHLNLVCQAIQNQTWENAAGKIDQLPPPEKTRDELERSLAICSDRRQRVILVEDFGDYKVFLQLPPNGKSECDFYVWRAIRTENAWKVKVPTHYEDLADQYLQLRTQHPDLEEYLINALLRLIRDRWSTSQIIQKYFNHLPPQLKNQTARFLATLKWIALQEDVNYPPSQGKLGSKFSLSVYALLEVGFTKKDLRRIIRF